MFGLLMSCIRVCVSGILLSDYLKRTFPEKYDEYLILASFELFRLYSRGQLLYIKVVQKINSIIEASPHLTKLVNEIHKTSKKNTERNEIYQIKNCSIHIKHYSNSSEIYFEPDENSIYLFCDNEGASETKCVNKVVLHSQPFSGKYEVSNIQFLLVEVKINDAAYKINLKTDTFNYYIVDNIFDLKFFKYYLYNYQIFNFTAEDMDKIDKLTVNIIDHDINMREGLEISNDRFIIIKKDGYIY